MVKGIQYSTRLFNYKITKGDLIILLQLLKDKLLVKYFYYKHTIYTGNETWKYQNYDDFIIHLGSEDGFELGIQFEDVADILIEQNDLYFRVLIESNNKELIESIKVMVNEKIDRRLDDKPKIFIGHGRNNQWRDLKDHLHDIHKYEIEAYEIGPRAGLSVKEVLEKMLNRSNFALIVLTGEDEFTDGTIHARENVIHEIGLFQGRIGFEKAIVLLEDGVKEFSNILGINQIRFSKNNIRETFGDVLGVIKDRVES
jgi:hypothetical protein